jgi:hypothetical protein
VVVEVVADQQQVVVEQVVCYTDLVHQSALQHLLQL